MLNFLNTGLYTCEYEFQLQVQKDGLFLFMTGNIGKIVVLISIDWG